MNRYQVDLDKASALWNRHFDSIADIFSTITELPDSQSVTALTHMLGQTSSEVRLIPYDDKERPESGLLSELVPPDDIIISIKHQCPNPQTKLKEKVKLQCRHIQLATGIMDNEIPAVITLNSPMNYAGGTFTKKGEINYPMLFIRPRLQSALAGQISEQEERLYFSNVRTWAVIANTFTKFPGSGRYNGNDPLATRSVADIKILGDKILEALQGSNSANNWLKHPDNLVYCAEFAHVALNLGLHKPLNSTCLGQELAQFVEGKLYSKEFLQNNKNPFITKVQLSMVPESLSPIAQKIGLSLTLPTVDQPFGSGLAVVPFTLADILEEAMKAVIPREQLGEESAPLQAKILSAAKPGILEVTGLNALSSANPKRAAVEALYEQLLQAVGKQYDNYESFRAAIAPLLQAAKKQSGPRGAGAGLYIPPHCFLVRATDAIEGKALEGLLTWEYVGHGLHQSLLYSEE